jgi:hypothetical protein
MLIDYAQKRSERVFLRSQAAMGAFSVVTARDAVKIRGSATIPAVMSDFVRSEEVRDTPDTDQLLKRKKPPAEFSLVCYAKVPTTKGRLPQWATLMRDSFGVEQMVIEILDFADLAGNSPPTSVTITIDGVATVLEEGASPDWTAETSNGQTAINLAAAINAIAGVSAVASGAEVLVTRDDGTGEVAITSNAAAADLRLGEVRYKLTSDILERPFTLVHGTHNAADYYRDCKVSAVQIIASGSDEATLVFSGMLGNGVFAGQTLLATLIDDLNGSSVLRDATDPVTFQVDDAVFQVGPTAEDYALVKIDDEVFKIPYDGWDPDTKTVTGALGCQLGTSPAAHALDAEVHPYLPGTDPDANDQIIGLTLGEFALDTVAHRVVSAEITKDEQLNGRLDEAFEAALTGYRRPLEGRLVEGTVIAYQRRSILVLSTFGEREKEAAATLRLGRSDGPRILVSLPKFRIGKVEKGEQDAEFTRTLPFQGLASGTPGNDGIAVSVFQ